MALSFRPDDWFLDSRDNPDTAVYSVTVNNHVEPLIDGASYMEKLCELLNSAGEGDFFYYAGLELNLDLRLIYTGDGTAENTVREVFRRARERGVDIRVMLSNHFHILPNSNNKADRVFRNMDKPIECILDSRFRDFGSAHQKFSILFTDRKYSPNPADRLPEKQLHAFCGGIDLQFDRWDDGTHRAPEYRQVADFPGGWHDVHTYVRGDACLDLLFMFQERWNNPEPPRSNERGPYTRITQPVPASTTAPPGNHFVQLLRTYSCGYQEVKEKPAPFGEGPIWVEEHVDYPFARVGEFSARNACIKAIGMAKDFIYIEDQYFFSYEIALALRDAMIANEKLKVIVLVAAEPTADQGTSLENYYHFKTLNGLELDLAQSGRLENFAIYELRNAKEEQIYVHAKLMIIDDIWVEIGSMNCNRRSTTHDLEACVAVVDGDTEPVGYGSYGVACKFARNLRLQLWAEHLGLAPDHLMIADAETGFLAWKAVAETKLAHARHHEPASDVMEWGYVWRTVADPQGTCAGTERIPDPWPE